MSTARVRGEWGGGGGPAITFATEVGLMYLIAPRPPFPLAQLKRMAHSMVSVCGTVAYLLPPSVEAVLKTFAAWPRVLLDQKNCFGMSETGQNGNIGFHPSLL